jgi:uncharacterized protein (TIGR03067 family)
VLFAFAVTLAGCGKNPAPVVTTPDASLSDKDRFQGVWKLESSDAGYGLKEAQEGNNARFQVVGDIASIRESATDPGEPYTASWEPEKNPKVMTLIPIGPEGKPRPGDTRRWIYKFEGDTLVVAYGFASAPPPDFRPDPGNGVLVLRYTKTNEQPVTKPTPAGK